MLKFKLPIEVILDDGLVAPGDENEMLDTGFAGFIHGVLDQRTVHDRQHLFGQGLRRGQETGSKAGDGKDCGAYTVRQIDLQRCVEAL
jgi:hypothetical protein